VVAKALWGVGLLLIGALAPVQSADAYFSSLGSGTFSTSASTLSAPTVTSATAGLESVSLSWSAVTPPGAEPVAYYVIRDGGAPGGNCPTSASPAAVTSCTDSGLSTGSHSYAVVAVWRTWTAKSSSTSVEVILGAGSHFVVTAATTTPTAGTSDNLTITAKDGSEKTITAYTGSHSLTFGPVTDSPSGAHATVTNSSGTPVNFGTATAISFTNGVASVSGSANGAMTLVKAGATSLTVSDGTIGNGTGLALTVSPASATSLSLSAASTTPTAGAADNLTITAKDAYGNTATGYTGAKNLTFGPLVDSPNGTHATVTNSSGTPVNFGTATAISFSSGVASVAGSANGAMTLVKAGSTSVTVSDGTIGNGSGLAVTVSPGSAASLSLSAASTTPAAGTADNLTTTAKDAYGNTATGYTGSHSLTFGPVADSPSGAHATVTNSSGTAVNFGTATAISFTSGVASVSGSANGVMTLVLAGSTSVTVSDGTIGNGSGLAVTVATGAAARLAWTHATSTGTLSSPCLFTCTGTGLGNSGNFKSNVSVTDSSGNTVSNLGSGHTVSVTAASGTVTGGSLTIASTGAAESTTQFTYTPSKSGAVTITAATSAGTAYTSATASMSR
jgi:hypothetical protein